MLGEEHGVGVVEVGVGAGLREVDELFHFYSPGTDSAFFLSGGGLVLCKDIMR